MAAGAAEESRAALRAALREAGLDCDVESRDALAILVGTATFAASLASPERRALALRLAREHGFTHVAVELSSGATGAALPGA